jgi:surfeit locus 1 family protein
VSSADTRSKPEDETGGEVGGETGATQTPRPTRPTLVAEIVGVLIALVLVGIAARLGLWQYHAWEARRAAEARDLTQLDPVPMTDLLGNDDPFPGLEVGRPVQVAGDWLDGGFWVEGREHDGTNGYWAVNPLAVGGEGQPAVLVVRGWAPEPSADALAVAGDAEITGWMQPPDGSIVTDDDASDDVFPEIRVADAIQRVDVDLYSAYVVLDHDRTAAADAIGADLEPAQLEALPEVGSFTALKNLLYAIEWWIFAAFAGWIWWRWRRDAHRAADAWEQAHAEAGPGDQPTDG